MAVSRALPECLPAPYPLPGLVTLSAVCCAIQLIGSGRLRGLWQSPEYALATRVD